jgi:DNA repair exonuclease SbcCD ATPase subunit
LKIKSLKMTGFKCHEKTASYLFGDQNSITGDNFVGKTTISEGIVWGLYGTDLNGSNQSFDRLLNNNSKSATVEIEVEIDGEVNRVVRTRKGSSTTVDLNERHTKQDELDDLLPDRKIFLAAFTQKYFAGLTNKDQREFLINLLPALDPKEVLSKLIQGDQGLLNGYRFYDTDVMMKDFRDELKNIDSEIIRTKGQLDVLRGQLNADIPVSRDFDESRVQELEDRIHSLRANVQQPELVDTRALDKRLSEIGAQYKLLVSQKEKTEKGTTFIPGTNCTHCGQVISEDHIHSLEENKRLLIMEIVAQMEDLKIEGTEVRKTLDETVAENNERQSKHKISVTNQINQLDSELRELKLRQQEVNDHNERRRSMIKLQKDAQAQIDEKEKYIKELETSKFTEEQRIQALKNYIQTYAETQNEQAQKHLNRVTISLTKIVKSTQEVKPDFELLYDGKPYRVISTSEEIRCGLEIAKMIREITGLQIPVFIDCKESITSKDFEAPADIQYFTASVVEGSDLTLEVINQKEAA